jgi:exosortase
MSKLATLAPEDTRGDTPMLLQEAVRFRPPAATLAAASAVAALLLWSYWPIAEWLYRTWSRNPDYSHGFLVPVFAIALLWLRRDLWPAHGIAPTTSAFAAGTALILAGGVARAAGIYVQIITLEALSLIPCAAGIALCCAGWPAVRVAWPAVAFLVFMIPIPSGLAGLLSVQLQRIATLASTFVLQLGGLPAVAEGNIIWLTETQIGVAEACSGLRMLVSFAALATGACLLIRRPLWEKAIVLASVPMLAIVANVARITATGAAYEFGSAELADKIFHDLAGWLMMPLGLGLLLAELAILSRIFLPAEQTAALRPQANRRRTDDRPARSEAPHPARRRSR